jgi:sugar lactone lactonase YvrE
MSAKPAPAPFTKAELVIDAKALLGEGPIWCAATRRLYWVNILESELHWFDPATGKDTQVAVGEHVGTVVPRARGGVMLAVQRGFASFDPAKGASSLTLMAEPERGRTDLRFNDGKCDPAGRFWAGTMAYDEANGAGKGSLYRLDPNGAVTVMERNVSISNGLAWDITRRRFYYIDSPTRTVAAYDYDHATGAIRNRRIAVQATPEDGWPDGMAIDVEGKLWVAHWGGSQVVRWDPDTGKAIARIATPISQPSACAFGGDRLDRLYITSARVGMAPAALTKEPLAGGLWVADPGVRGMPQTAFAG